MKYFLTSILLWFSFLSLAQNGFSRIYEMENFKWDKIQQIIEVEGQLILIIATNCDSFDGDNCLNIISTDLAGEELWRIEKLSHQIEDHMDIAFFWNEHIYVAVEDLNANGQIQAFQIDLAGNLVDTHILFNTVPETFRFMGIVANGDIFTTCSTIDLDEDHSQAKLSFFDSDFDWQGEKILSSEETNVGFQDIKPGYDGGYVFTSNNFTFGIGFELKVQKLTADGSIEWGKILEPSQFYTKPSVETNTFGDVFIIYVRIQDFFDDPKYFLHVEKLDNEGNEIWVNNHLVSGAEIRSYERMILTSENEMLYFGSGEAMGPDNGYSGFAAKVNNEGELVWEKAYRDADLGGRTTNLFDGVVLDNGDIIMGGDLRNTIDVFRNDPWLLRTNADGCVYTEACGDINLVTPTHDLANDPMKQFYLTPTLVQDQVTIRQSSEVNIAYNKLRIVTASGQIVYEDIAQAFPFTVKTIQLPSGFYFLQIYDDKGRRQSLKFVKQ